MPNMRKGSWPEALFNNAIEKGNCGSIPFRDGWIMYAVLKSTVNPKLPGFAGCITEDGRQFFYISEDVPKHFRELILLHEAQEFIVHEEQPGSCLKSLQYELTLIPEYLREEYLLYRRDFFRRLVPFCVKSNYSEQRIKDFQESLDYLEGIVTSER